MNNHATDASAILARVDDLATLATSKLELEAGQQEYCLRRMVLTANLLDDLTDEMHKLRLRVSLAATLADRQARIRWADRVAEGLKALEDEGDDCGSTDDEDDSASDVSSDVFRDEELMPPTPPTPVDSEDADCYVKPAGLPRGDATDEDEHGAVFALDEDLTALELTRYPTKPAGGGVEVNVAIVEVEVIGDEEDGGLPMTT